MPYADARRRQNLGSEGTNPALVLNNLNPVTLTEASQAAGGDLLFSRQGAAHFLFVEPETVSEVLVNSASGFIKGEQEIALSQSIGWGLLVDEGESHRRAQSEISPELRGKALEKYARIVSKTVRTNCSRISSDASTPLVDWARALAQESAEKALFPSPVREFDDRYGPMVMELNSLVQRTDWGEISASEALDETRRFHEVQGFIQNYVSSLVDDWKGQERTEPTLMDVLVRHEPDPEVGGSTVEAQTALFLQAATETTGALVSWAIVALADQPELWLRVVEESHSAVGDDPFQVMERPHLTAAVSEALRLFPPAWMSPRIAVEDLEVGRFSVPAGSRVVVSPWVTHRREDLFKEADRFVSSRWLDNLKSSLPRGAYYPFGLGKRICVGERFARLNAGLILDALARRKGKLVLNSASRGVGNSALIANPSHELRFGVQ